MEVRLLLAFLLMGAVMFLTPYFFKSQAPPPGKKDAGRPRPKPRRAALPRRPARRRHCRTPAAAVEKVAAAAFPACRRHAAEGRAASWSSRPTCTRSPSATRARTVRSWLLKKYKGNDNKTLDLVNTAAGMDFPYSLYFPNQKPAGQRQLDLVQADRRSGRPGRHLRVLRRPRQRAQGLPLPEERAIFRWCPPKSRWTASRCPT